MIISVDGGGLCVPPNKQFGNYIFSFNLLKAISFFDKHNQYFVYTFCSRKKDWPLAKNFYYQKLAPKFLWMKLRVFWQENINKKDIFLALNQAIPFYTPAKIISFCHGLSYYYFPHFYRNSYSRLISHFKAVILKSDYIIVSSSQVKNELQEQFPKLKNIIVIPYGIPFDMLDKKTKFRPEQIGAKLKAKEKFFLFVGMNHPIKNVGFLIDVFLQFIKKKEFSSFKLYLVGGFKEYIDLNQNIVVIDKCHRQQLKQYYQKATAYLTASFYESFNLPALEALSQGCPVIGLPSAIIPELKSYVSLAENKEIFISKMQQIANKKLIFNYSKKIEEKFSWKHYLEKLIKLYQL